MTTRINALHRHSVDDASPVTAASEIDALPSSWRQRISVLRQTNRGPGGARNAALDRIPEGTGFVAFIDSDDEWTPGHLQRCIGWMKTEGADCCWETMTAEAEVPMKCLRVNFICVFSGLAVIRARALPDVSERGMERANRRSR